MYNGQDTKRCLCYHPQYTCVHSQTHLVVLRCCGYSSGPCRAPFRTHFPRCRNVACWYVTDETLPGLLCGRKLLCSKFIQRLLHQEFKGPSAESPRRASLKGNFRSCSISPSMQSSSFAPLQVFFCSNTSLKNVLSAILLSKSNFEKTQPVYNNQTNETSL